jgi:hypothetical protein
MNWLKQRVVILQISILLPAVVGFVLWWLGAVNAQEVGSKLNK